MSRAERRAQLLDFLETIRRPEQPLEGIEDHESLVDSGLIDSLALLEIVNFLEAEYGLDFAVRGLDPAELATIDGILALVEAGPA